MITKLEAGKKKHKEIIVNELQGGENGGTMITEVYE